MFKSIEYKLILFLVLLVVAAAGATLFFLRGEVWYGGGCALIAGYAVNRLWAHYRKFNKNILFLLNAMENGDYSFHFSETKLSRREQELNTMLNRIKEILSSARKEVIENEQFLSLIVESVSTGIVILEDNGGVRTVNREAGRLLGLPVFTHISQLATVDARLPATFRNLPLSEPVQITIPNEREEVLISLRTHRIVLKNREMKIITLNNIGNELEAREMESWVKLIRVMTHEIMNSIAPITSLSDTLLAAYRAGEAPAADTLAADTVEAFETINSTARGLLLFVESYRKFTGVPKPVLSDIAVGPLLKEVVTLNSEIFKEKGIAAEIVVANPDLTVRADRTQITQVLVNLLKNATDAIGDTSNGKILLKAAGSAHAVEICVANNGRPIDPEVAPHIFVPFFTTKDTGTGIGLSLSRYIMRLHGGNLKHHGEGGMTVFTMVFPAGTNAPSPTRS